MGHIQETTDELLNIYNNKNHNNLDDLTIFSDNEIPYSFDNILDKSIDLGRTPQKLSPFKKYGISPLKQPINNYQDQVLQMRSGSQSNSNSPLKRKSKPKRNSFSIADILNESTFDDDLIQTLDKHLKSKPEKKTLHLDQEDKDGTELIIRETHNLINKIPDSITSNKESEEYIEILSNSVKRLTHQLETIKLENMKLKSDVSSSLRMKLVVQSLEDSNNALVKENNLIKIENNDLKIRLDQVQRKAKQRIPQENSHLTKENNLLRDKLKKYKSLYEDSKKKHEKADSVVDNPDVNESPREHEDKIEDPNKQIIILLTQIANLMEKPKSVPNNLPSSPAQMDTPPRASNKKLLSLFEEIAENMKKQNVEKSVPSEPKLFENPNNNVQPNLQNRPADSQSAREHINHREESYYSSTPGEINNTRRQEGLKNLDSFVTLDSNSNNDKLNEQFLERLLETVKENNDLQSKVFKLFSEDMVDLLKLPKRENNEKEVVVKCYMCCPHNINEDNKKKVCQKCSMRDEELTNGIQSENRTVNLMGEYKWNI